LFYIFRNDSIDFSVFEKHSFSVTCQISGKIEQFASPKALAVQNWATARRNRPPTRQKRRKTQSADKSFA
jgi:hypothetical protein